MSEQIKRVVSAFSRQAKTFNQYQQAFSKEEYNRFALSHMDLQATDNVLEVAAGTCGFGRAVAPHVHHITELDVTEAMLNIGREAASEQGMTNVSFVQGEAEHLPFADASFDCVVSRLAFHHFAEPKAAIAEMRRVLKSGGRLVIIDMRAREEALRETADRIEKLRDPSHVRCLSEAEFRCLADGMRVTFCETIPLPVSLLDWMDVTEVPAPARAEITQAMEAELCGGLPTGFEAYREDGRIMFCHRWMLLAARKAEGCG